MLPLLLLPIVAALPHPQSQSPSTKREVDPNVLYIRGKRDVYTNYPYTGPAVPIADWADQSVNGNDAWTDQYANGTGNNPQPGFARLNEPPAVWPSGPNPTNNINTINMAFFPGGINIHFSTPFGIGGDPCVNYGTDQYNLNTNVKGATTTYDRTPPCSAYDSVTLCSQFFHNVQISGLQPGTTYFYQIPGGNGTTPSHVLQFTTARAPGDTTPFTVAVINDMGYTNAKGTHSQLIEAVSAGASFAWHGGDISYADDWFEGILPCVLTGSDAENCYNGTSSTVPPGDDFDYYTPLPEGEEPNQGGPQGGDFSTMYETNWDLWQNWMNPITTRIPYMTNPGNHEATCAEFDGPNNELTAYLVNDQINGTAPNSTLSYYSCPPSQRNFTAYQHRFKMPGDVTGGRGNFWYSFDYGLAHFISFDGETDYYQSPESPFIADTKGEDRMPTEKEAYLTSSGPFGNINGNYTVNANYEQVQWLKDDLAKVDRSKTPWVFAQTHRPMYSSEVSAYQKHMRSAFEDILLEYNVDAYFAGHIHWYERTYPLGPNGTIVQENYINNNTYTTGNGKAIAHLTNGQAGNIESHSTLAYDDEPRLNITAFLDQEHYGFSRLSVINATTALWEYIHGDDGQCWDYLYMQKE